MPSVRRSPDTSGSGQPPKKKMRQGTHSCIECRRRKIKCIFLDGRPNVCNECFSRGIQCVDQESAAEFQTVETRQSLRERVANLESLVKSLATKVDTDDGGSTSSERSLKTAPITTDLSTVTSGLDHAPIMSLFNNSLITGRATSEEPEENLCPTEVKPGAKTPDERIRQKLLAFVPRDKDIEIIFEEASSWRKIWERYFPELELSKSPSSLATFTKKAIASGTLLALAKGLLCIVLSLQQITASCIQNRLELPLPAEELMHHYTSTIEKYIIGNDQYCGTIEGLECAVLLTKIDSNAGRPRKAWLTHRRALSFALMMGLNRKQRWQRTATDQISGPRRRGIFLSLFQGDRFFSLLLGLPYYISDQHCDIGQMAQEDEELHPGLNMHHVIKLSNLCGRLIDRCQNPDLVSLASTMQLEQELEELSAGLPNLVRRNSQGRAQSFEELYDCNVMRFYHHYIRGTLHLPYMLKSDVDRRYEYSRIAAIDSAREMIYAYRGLHSGASSGFCICKTIDFQVFAACITLAINIQGCKATGAQSDPFSDEKDWQLINEVKNILQVATTESALTSNVQDQAARTLSLFLASKDMGSCGASLGGTCKIVVPYFGTITVTPRADAVSAFRHRVALQQPTPPFQPSFPPSTASTPSAQQWQLPTPPRGASSMSTISDTASPHAPDPCIAFDPFNLPLPAGSDGSGLMQGDTQAVDFYDPILGHVPDWTGGYDWTSMPGGGMDLELDSDWNWVVSGSQQQHQVGAGVNSTN